MRDLRNAAWTIEKLGTRLVAKTGRPRVRLSPPFHAPIDDRCGSLEHQHSGAHARRDSLKIKGTVSLEFSTRPLAALRMLMSNG